MNTSPRTSLTVALVLLLLLGIGHLFVPFVPDMDKIPPVVVYGDVALGALSLVAAFGLLQRRRWGLILTLIIAALNVVSAAPGVVAAPNVGLRVVTALYLVLSLVIIALVVFPSGREAATNHAPWVQK